jgi:hypothetical protein
VPDGSAPVSAVQLYYCPNSLSGHEPQFEDATLGASSQPVSPSVLAIGIIVAKHSFTSVRLFSRIESIQSGTKGDFRSLLVRSNLLGS